MDPALLEFKASHGLNSFLCRWRNCPRASQGFSSSQLRQQHEDSHNPQFRCTNESCWFFRRTFKTRSAANKHISQYHDNRSAPSIPDSLSGVQNQPRQERPLFQLKESFSITGKLSQEKPPPVPIGELTRPTRSPSPFSLSFSSLSPFPSPPLSPSSSSLPRQEQPLFQLKEPTQGTILSHRKQTQIKEPSVTDVGNFLADLNFDDLPSDRKQKLADWQVVYNPRVQRTCSVEAVLLLEESDWINSVCFSPDDKFVAIGYDQAAAIYETLTGRILAVLTHPEENYVSNICFSPCGKYLVTVSEDCNLQVSYAAIFRRVRD